MRYRSLDANGDYTIGQPFLKDSSACVAQAILTRLKLWKGEWFLDVNDGTPYRQQVLGRPSNGVPDAVIKQRILATPGVLSILTFSSTFVGGTRGFAINATVTTQYGTVAVSL